MKRKMVLTLIAATLFCSLNSFGQVQASPQMKAADELLGAGKFTEAAAAYEGIVKAEPSNAPAWYQLGVARYSLKQYPGAAEAFRKNIEIGKSGFSMYNLACVYSLMDDKERSIEWLTKSVDEPTMVLPAVNFSDPDLARVKDDPRFIALKEKVDRKIHPCLYTEGTRQFDFWVGEWDVFNPQGRHSGTSSIQGFANGCGILENWTDSFGGTGKSINFYDPGDKKWYQYWVGQNGVPLRYSGVYRDGAVRYEGETTAAGGKKSLLRLSFFNVDQNTVRQLAETSADEGKTWQTSYDFKYVRKK
jgi:tetratricopeptide (TPR) repeat protein